MIAGDTEGVRCSSGVVLMVVEVRSIRRATYIGEQAKHRGCTRQLLGAGCSGAEPGVQERTQGESGRRFMRSIRAKGECRAGPAIWMAAVGVRVKRTAVVGVEHRWCVSNLNNI